MTTSNGGSDLYHASTWGGPPLNLSSLFCLPVSFHNRPSAAAAAHHLRGLQAAPKPAPKPVK